MAPMVANTLLGPEATTLHRQRLLDSMAALHKESYIKTVEATTHYDKSADLSAIAVPTLLVFAEQDRLTTPKIGVRMAEKIRNSRLEVIANAGHLVNIEFPQIFNALILDFLRSNPMGQRYDV